MLPAEIGKIILNLLIGELFSGVYKRVKEKYFTRKEKSCAETTTTPDHRGKQSSETKKDAFLIRSNKLPRSVMSVSYQ